MVRIEQNVSPCNLQWHISKPETLNSGETCKEKIRIPEGDNIVSIELFT